MNLNEFFATDLSGAIGIPVSEDIYEGDADKYITFTYQDERPTGFADNHPIEDECEVYVNLYVPKDYDYFEMKESIRDYLEAYGFFVSMQSWLENGKKQTELIRRITFDCSLKQKRQ